MASERPNGSRAKLASKKTGRSESFYGTKTWGCQKVTDLRRVVVKSPGKGLHKLLVKFGVEVNYPYIYIYP